MKEHFVFGLLAEALSCTELGPEQEIDLTWLTGAAPFSVVLTYLGGIGASGSISFNEFSRFSLPTSM